CHARADGIELFVSDEGPGIPEAEQEAVFREFHQLDNPERAREKGLGLGLAIVHRLALLLDIDLKLDSEPDRGCRFGFLLQRGDPNQVSALPVHDDAGDVPFPDCHVLLVEDDAMVREAMGGLLQDWGCRVTACADLEALERDPEVGSDCALVVADQRLPRGRLGYEAIALVRQRQGRDVPALVITGETDSLELERQELAGIPVLHKPVRPPRLRLMMQRMLETSG
ncbi:MAG: response regulator, partial [Gammaproteobacteria bacterium]